MRRRWEPSWEPLSVDPNGRPGTPRDSETRTLTPDRHSWTPMDTAWRSTDQEVGCSSRPGRAGKNLAPQGLSVPHRPRDLLTFGSHPSGPKVSGGKVSHANPARTPTIHGDTLCRGGSTPIRPTSTTWRLARRYRERSGGLGLLARRRGSAVAGPSSTSEPAACSDHRVQLL